jgi:hypothetical protein
MQTTHSTESLEFKGGYALFKATELEVVLSAYRDQKINAHTLRVYAAQYEHAVIEARGSKASLARIINGRLNPLTINHLSDSEISEALKKLRELLDPLAPQPERPKPVSRIALRAIAHGQLTVAESLVIFAYFSRRLVQRRPGHSIRQGQRYARLSYSDLESLSGVDRALLARAVCSLCAKGWLTLVPVTNKESEARYGLCCVDGNILSIEPSRVREQAPSTRYKVRVEQEATKRLTLDVPESLHRLIKVQCAKNGTSMYEELCAVLMAAYADSDDLLKDL